MQTLPWVTLWRRRGRERGRARRELIQQGQLLPRAELLLRSLLLLPWGWPEKLGNRHPKPGVSAQQPQRWLAWRIERRTQSIAAAVDGPLWRPE
jgi:hypothetical protein